MLVMILTHNRAPREEGHHEPRVQGRWQEPLKLEIYLILFKNIHLTLIYFSSIINVQSFISLQIYYVVHNHFVQALDGT